MNTRFNSLVALETPLSFARFHMLADGGKPGFYPGVLIIQKGPAKGHYAVKEESGRVVNFDKGNPDHAQLQKFPIHIGDATLDDVVTCGNESEQVKGKLDHGATVRDIVGNYSVFRRDGDSVRADLALMQSTPHRAYVEELIATMSKKIGNSIDFDYVYDIKGNVAVARCTKLNSVDIVDAPAATNSLFKQNPTQPAYDMPLSPEDLTAIRSVVQSEVASQFATVKTDLNSQFAILKTKLEEGESDEADKKEKEDADKEKEKDKAELASLVKTAALSAVREVLPQAVVQNLASLSAANPAGDPYAEKLALAKGAGMTDVAAVRHIARTFPSIYNAKFGVAPAQSVSL